MSLHLGGPEVNLEHHPGPTPGSIWVIIPAAQVIFVGDSLTINQPPFLAQADLPVWIENLEALAKSYANYRIISGRGGLASTEDVRTLRKLLKDISHKMEQLAERNAAPEATQELIPLLLSNYTFPPQMQELYTARLRYGLYHCFTKRYRPTSVSGQTEIEEEEQ
jgi:glyoxylase-like metal-dependent hydrolase (beta-lactamase superfamily II)